MGFFFFFVAGLFLAAVLLLISVLLVLLASSFCVWSREDSVGLEYKRSKTEADEDMVVRKLYCVELPVQEQVVTREREREKKERATREKKNTNFLLCGASPQLRDSLPIRPQHVP